MKAMILAGGLGTRLSPLTDNKPKALVPFKGVPLLERVVRNIAAAGINHIIVNVHHFAEQVIEFMDHLHIDGVELSVSDETRQLMDTGGALLHAREFFEGDEDFLVHNVDVVTNLDISAIGDTWFHVVQEQTRPIGFEAAAIGAPFSPPKT